MRIPEQTNRNPELSNKKAGLFIIFYVFLHIILFIILDFYL